MGKTAGETSLRESINQHVDPLEPSVRRGERRPAWPRNAVGEDWSRLRRRTDGANYAVARLSWQELTRSRIAVSTASGCDIIGTWSLSIS